MFLSEGARQMFETLRNWRRNAAATKIQSTWRGIKCRRHWPSLKKTLKAQKVLNNRFSARPANGTSTFNGEINLSNHLANGLLNGNRPRPQPISGTPPPEVCDSRVIEQTCSYFGLDLKNPPPVPPSRSYTVAGNAKLGYPQVIIHLKFLHLFYFNSTDFLTSLFTFYSDTHTKNGLHLL